MAWQLAHPVTTNTLAWNLAGNQLVPDPVLWQVVQLAVVGTCLALLPVAVVPLWQLAQSVLAVKVLWSTLAPVHTLVDLWQVSQAALVTTWLLDLVEAMVPL